MSLTSARCGLLVRTMFAFALLVASAGVTAQTPTQAPTPTKGILWEIKSNGNTAYLFGSIHLAKPDFYPLPEAVERAYQQAKLFALELDPTDQAAVAKVMPLLTYTPPDQLQKHLKKSTWLMLETQAGPEAVASLQTLRPAMLSTVFAMGTFARLGYAPESGIDLHFLNQAKADHKKIVELETMAFQAGVLGGLSDQEGNAMVRETLQGLASGELIRQTEAMISAWKAGDPLLLDKKLRAANGQDVGSRKVMKRLLDDRNVTMAASIKALINAGEPVFIVVGSGHVVGKNGIPEILKKQGYQVRLVN